MKMAFVTAFDRYNLFAVSPTTSCRESGEVRMSDPSIIDVPDLRVSQKFVFVAKRLLVTFEYAPVFEISKITLNVGLQ